MQIPNTNTRRVKNKIYVSKRDKNVYIMSRFEYSYTGNDNIYCVSWYTTTLLSVSKGGDDKTERRRAHTLGYIENDNM